MADQAAGITLKVDASSVRTANTALDSFAQKSETTEWKAKNITDNLKLCTDEEVRFVEAMTQYMIEQHKK